MDAGVGIPGARCRTLRRSVFFGTLNLSQSRSGTNRPKSFHCRAWAAYDLVWGPTHLSAVSIMVIEPPQNGESAVERRSYLRVEVRLEYLAVTVGVLGFEATKGGVLNVSRSGLKVALSREISELLVGSDCLVRFVDLEDRVNPMVNVGKLRRMEADAEYAIEFESPLEALNMGGDPSETPGATSSE